MDFYNRSHTDEIAWICSYQSSKAIMDYPFDADLYFEEKESLVTTRIPGGRIAMLDNSPSINVHPYLFTQLTSENLRQYLYCHEIAEIEISNSPISIYFCFFNILHGKPYYKREIYANKMVYASLTKRIGEETAIARMRTFVDEWLDLRPKEYLPRFASAEEYILKTMPFLIEE
ncbi:MAG: hypothetical protein NDI94_01250 [Candidatus Woesearchaeota archaeon]|nr:hypothetical protein [Candidatus Woesearchaeota archaeon]